MITVNKHSISRFHLEEYIEKFKFKTRYDVLCFLIGYCGAVTKEEFELVEKLYADEIIEE